MRLNRMCLVVSIGCVTLSAMMMAARAGQAAGDDRQAMVRTCIGEDEAAASIAIASLREVGQEGLDALCAEHDRLAAQVQSNAKAADSPLDPRIPRLRSAIDAVAKQRDAYASRLFWLTDFEQAKAQAAASGKPILSLRLLGNLDEDLSCANSRFFRSILYANAQVSGYLREHYVLHWESLRPVPKMTIDFGDGRRIERTITGNSIHYVLDSQGEIIDALPGLYGPAPLLRALEAAETVLRQSRMMSDARNAAELLQFWHASQVVRIDNHLREDMQRANAAALANAVANANNANVLLAVPAAAIAPTKMRAEVKAVEAAIDMPGAIGKAGAANDDALWEQVAMLHTNDAMFDQASVAFIESKLPTEMGEAAHELTMTKRMEETPAMRMFRTLRQSVAIDTVRNEYQLHRTIHEWLAQPRLNSDQSSGAAADVKSFNERVYAELFLTPLDDPWMGLVPRDAYAAIDRGGLIEQCE